MRNLRKKLWILLVIAAAFSISACGMKADVSEQVSEQTLDEQTAETSDEQMPETPDTHKTAIDAMKTCQIDIIA